VFESVTKFVMSSGTSREIVSDNGQMCEEVSDG
jgi:hypothetical protein